LPHEYLNEFVFYVIGDAVTDYIYVAKAAIDIAEVNSLSSQKPPLLRDFDDLQYCLF